jgi:hypothetical protein
MTVTDDETLVLRATVIGGKRHAHDITVIWRDLPISLVITGAHFHQHDRAETANLRRQWRSTCGHLLL